MSICNILYVSMLQTALQKAAFYTLKGGLLACDLPSFGRQNAMFWKSTSLHTTQQT